MIISYDGIIVGNFAPFDMSRVSLKYNTRPISLALSSLPVYMAVGHIKYKLASVMLFCPLGHSANGQSTLILALFISERHGMAMASRGITTPLLSTPLYAANTKPIWVQTFCLGL